MDGISTAERVRSRFDIPVIFLTAHADGETLRRANQTEPYGYLVKPFNPCDISVAVEVALNRHRLTSKLKQQEVWVSTVLNSVGDAVIAVDFDGNIRYMNLAAQNLTGWTTDECAGQPFERTIALSFADQTADECDPDLRFMPTEPSEAPSRISGTLVNRKGEQMAVRVVSSEIGLVRGNTNQGRVLVISKN
jgi:PAS domain S-box-containing protein